MDWKLENIRILIADKTHRINGTIMRKILSNLLVIMVLSCAGCNLWITGKVVEAETEKPIQGAIVVAQWLQVRGLPFMGYHTVYKIVETETDKDGFFSLPGAYNPLVGSPEMIICSKGRIPWRNDSDFETQEDYSRKKWNSRETYRLNKLKAEHSRVLLSRFIDHAFNPDYTTTPKFAKYASGVGEAATEEINKKKILRNESAK